ncbi:hypothetical protein CCH79_00016718 [Gambusia affinis]|uniref:Uncharacterized protein n=1 Tax=Gambusia affinis TaxID=33528 RepID=A0A315UPK5_GAMAF|nr:hypothetical protein CCH79_00016718 [Gambusia affinis]
MRAKTEPYLKLGFGLRVHLVPVKLIKPVILLFNTQFWQAADLSQESVGNFNYSQEIRAAL